MSQKKDELKSTLNLPKTSFGMRANLAQNEPFRLKQWEKNKLHEQVSRQGKDRVPFIFHDGPPYANGDIHVGHLLNKVLKDLVVRTRPLLNQSCTFIPGWDCHGLPIEHKVMGLIFEKDKAKFLGLEPAIQRKIVRKKSAEYAAKYIKAQKQQMKALLTTAEYEAPYLTMDPAYEAKVLHVFASLLDEGLVYRQNKPVHWSIDHQTALADAELEYHDRTDTAVFLGFDVLSDLPRGIAANASVQLLVWTTTPWTLPANLALAVSKEAAYVVATCQERTFVCCEDLVPHIESLSGQHLVIEEKLSGSDLVGLTYQHPFCDRKGRVFHADFVTTEDGSGLVHIAPGHGSDDYQLGQAHGLETYCPVDAEGVFDDTVPDWVSGQQIWKANPVIVEQLQKSGHLFHAYDFSHSYPHDWRSKSPVIFRSTPQWFVSVDRPLKQSTDSLRQLALKAIQDEVQFRPDWGKNRLRGMMESRPDWCLSRQRSWGLPIPAFVFQEQVVLTAAMVRAVSDCFAEHGSDAWFEKAPDQLLATYDIKADPDAPKGLTLAALEKTFDIFDVWFESGSSWHAVVQARLGAEQADLYCEGSDQHRGWFHLSLLPALGVMKKAPFKQVLTHGFIVDKEGKKMSKSGGNALSVSDLLKKYGAEVLRFWVAQLSIENDIKVDVSYFDLSADMYRKVRNTLRFLLSNLYEFEGSDEAQLKLTIEALPPHGVNAHILAQFNQMASAVLADYEALKFKQASTRLYRFLTDDLSSIYATAVKDWLYCDAKDSLRRVQTQSVIWVILKGLLVLLRPILPHTTDEAYQALVGQNQSIHLQALTLFESPAQGDWQAVLGLRDEVLKALEACEQIDNPLDAGVEIEGDAVLAPFQAELSDLLGVSRATFLVSRETNACQIKVVSLHDQPRCERSWRRDETVCQRDNGFVLSERDYQVMVGCKV